MVKNNGHDGVTVQATMTCNGKMLVKLDMSIYAPEPSTDRPVSAATVACTASTLWCLTTRDWIVRAGASMSVINERRLVAREQVLKHCVPCTTQGTKHTQSREEELAETSYRPTSKKLNASCKLANVTKPKPLGDTKASVI